MLPALEICTGSDMTGYMYYSKKSSYDVFSYITYIIVTVIISDRICSDKSTEGLG